MIRLLFRERYAAMFSFIFLFLIVSVILRSFFLLESIGKADFTAIGIIRVYLLGTIYDLNVALYLTFIYNIYLLLLPGKWSNYLGNKLVTYSILSILLMVSFFSFFAEVTFWNEFESRFNFIAVDYLIYTYEVVHNINESYPIVWLLLGWLVLVLLVGSLFIKLKIFKKTFESKWGIKERMKISLPLIAITICYAFLLKNSDAEIGNNRYENELSKAGIFSFFAAFRSNELDYNLFYANIPQEKALNIVRNQLKTENTTYLDSSSLFRFLKNEKKTVHPNIIMITVESLSADFLAHFGNTAHLTPALDSLADQGILFTNMYATGTRTVRGMEALTLSIPPTPGNSIVRRADNKNLFQIGSILKNKGYSREFFYGGDGYFDNMNEYFGSNGFDISDRGRANRLNDTYSSIRTNIPDHAVHFENAWGVCDEDLFSAVLRKADLVSKSGQPFYNFIMTTSNHRPFTFPDGRINLPKGSREAAVKYTDFAIKDFLRKAKLRDWYANTIFIIIADHCASSAGKDEIDISKYHIPCIILNIKEQPARKIKPQCSQIDLYPTLFHLLGWDYKTKFFGKDVLNPQYKERAFLGTYQKLGYLQQDSLVILSPQKKVNSFIYRKKDNAQVPINNVGSLVNRAIAYYQTAYDLYKTGKLNNVE